MLWLWKSRIRICHWTKSLMRASQPNKYLHLLAQIMYIGTVKPKKSWASTASLWILELHPMSSPFESLLHVLAQHLHDKMTKCPLKTMILWALGDRWGLSKFRRAFGRNLSLLCWRGGAIKQQASIRGNATEANYFCLSISRMLRLWPHIWWF